MILLLFPFHRRQCFKALRGGCTFRVIFQHPFEHLSSFVGASIHGRRQPEIAA